MLKLAMRFKLIVVCCSPSPHCWGRSADRASLGEEYIPELTEIDYQHQHHSPGRHEPRGFECVANTQMEQAIIEGVSR